jgi:hypothetical protein
MGTPNPRTLDAKTGWRLFATAWVAMLLTVFALRQALIPRAELDCYARSGTLDRAVKAWNKAHPERVMDEKGEIDESALVSGGFLKKALTYDAETHYYFVEQKVHGPRVKCNKHEDQPWALKLAGVTLLSLLAFVAWCSFKDYVLWKA